MWLIRNISVVFPAPPAYSMYAKVSYRKKSDPDISSSYVIVGTELVSREGNIEGLKVIIPFNDPVILKTEIKGCTVAYREFSPPTDAPATTPPTVPPTVPPTTPPTTPPTVPPTIPPTIPPTVPPTAPPTIPPTVPVTECVRPAGLTRFHLVAEWDNGQGFPHTRPYNFSGSIQTSCEAWNEFKTRNGELGLNSLGDYHGHAAAIEVGQTVYNFFTSPDCATLPNGNYWYAPYGSSPLTTYFWAQTTISIVTITAGSISAINTCTITATEPPATEPPPTEPPVFIWIADTAICESAGELFLNTKTIPTLSSPLKLLFDAPTGNFYGIDQDDFNGNFFKFNPNTATQKSDLTYFGAANRSMCYTGDVDKANRRLFTGGATSGGILVFDIATEQVNVIPFGSNANYNKMAIKILESRVVFYDASVAQVKIIDRSTLADIGSPINVNSGIPGGSSYFSNAFNITQVNNELWISAAQRPNGNIAVYDLGLTTLLGVINIPSLPVGGWGSGLSWQSAFYDVAKDKFYLGDIGSNSLYIIDGATRSIVYTKTFYNKQGKASANTAASQDPITGDVYISYYGLNSANDTAQIKRLYLINRDTFVMELFYDGQVVNEIVNQEGTGFIWAPNPALPQWLAGSWNTDGSILQYGYVQGLDNTGVYKVITLKEVNQANGDPTGSIKPNTPSDPDFIPPVTDFTECPIEFNTMCPTDLKATQTSGKVYYEFTLPGSVARNPAIAKIRVRIMSGSTQVAFQDILLPHVPSNYFDGVITVVDDIYTISLQYINSGDEVIGSCSANVYSPLVAIVGTIDASYNLSGPNIGQMHMTINFPSPTPTAISYFVKYCADCTNGVLDYCTPGEGELVNYDPATDNFVIPQGSTSYSMNFGISDVGAQDCTIISLEFFGLILASQYRLMLTPARNNLTFSIT